MNRRVRLSLAAALAAGLVAASAAAPAVADEDDIRNSNIYWSSVEDTFPYISDAESSYPDLLGSGVDLPFGWTGDAFDGFLEDVRFNDDNVDFAPATGGAGWVDGGLSSFTYVGTLSAIDPTFEIDATLELQGNYARWVFTPVSGPTGTLELSANLGSDSYQTATVVTANSAVVSSDDNLADPVIGYWASGTDVTLQVPDAVDDSDTVVIAGTTSAAVTVVIALQDYAPCAQDVAVAEMVARVAALNSSFGQAIEGALECAAVVAPGELTLDAVASQTLAVTIDPEVDAWLLDPWSGTSLEDGYLGDPQIVGSAFVGGPAGVTFAFDPETALVTLSGTPTAAGTFDVALVLYLDGIEDYIEGELGYGYPLVAHFTVTVAGPQLAATGASDATPVLAMFGGLLVLAGAGALRLRRRLVAI
jgi:hypothetical protein